MNPSGDATGMSPKTLYRCACVHCGGVTFTVDTSRPVCTGCKSKRVKAYQRKRKQRVLDIKYERELSVRQLYSGTPNPVSHPDRFPNDLT